jgi:hypothetical protein
VDEVTVASGDSNTGADVPLEPGYVYRLDVETFVELPGWLADALIGALRGVGLAASVSGSTLSVWFTAV